MALFEAAAKQLVKDSGRLTSHSVLELNSADNCKLLCVVEKRKKRWFWKATKFLPTPFSINDLLTEPIDVIKDAEKSTFMTKYKNEPQFHASGKLGGKFASELGIDLSATDSFTVSMNLGTVLKSCINWQILHDALAAREFKLDHEFVQKILGSKRSRVCVIYEVLTCSGDSELDSDHQAEGDTSITGGKASLSINISGYVKDSHHRSMEIPNNTVLAYACYEVTTCAGRAELKLQDFLQPDEDNKQTKCCGVFDEPDAGKGDQALLAVLNGFIKSPDHAKMVECYKQILETPQCISPLKDLLESALSATEGEKQKELKYGDLKRSVGDKCHGWQAFLRLIGFTIDEDDLCQVKFPSEDSGGVLTSCTAIMEALVELSPAQCLSIRALTSDHLEPLLYLIKNALYGKNTPEDDPQLKRFYTHSSNPGKTFLLSLGFELVMENEKNVLRVKKDFQYIELEDAYVAVYALCAD